jgi:hypothetical protein
MMARNKQLTVRVREIRRGDIEQLALDLTIQEKFVIRPNDVIDALIWKYLKKVSVKDIYEAMNHR